jgi:hypothetical protein
MYVVRHIWPGGEAAREFQKIVDHPGITCGTRVRITNTKNGTTEMESQPSLYSRRLLAYDITDA